MCLWWRNKDCSIVSFNSLQSSETRFYICYYDPTLKTCQRQKDLHVLCITWSWSGWNTICLFEIINLLKFCGLTNSLFLIKKISKTMQTTVFVTFFCLFLTPHPISYKTIAEFLMQLLLQTTMKDFQHFKYFLVQFYVIYKHKLALYW